MNSQKVGMIGLMKFIFSIVLVIFHAYLLYENNPNIHYPLLERGAISVEFFFLVSGYLMAMSIHKQKESNLTNDACHFIFHKIMNFLPTLLLCWCFSFIVVNIFTYQSFSKLVTRFFESIFEVLLIRNAGFNAYRVIPSSWYLSAMILCMAVIYPLYYKNKSFFESYVAPLIAIFILGYLYYNIGSLVNPNYHLGLFYKSTLRALAELCLGIYCYSLVTKFHKISLTQLGKNILSLIEIFGYFFSFFYMQFYKKFFNAKADFIVLLILAVSVTISFSKKSSISSKIGGKIIEKLERFSIYPFLVYCPYSKILPIIASSFSPINLFFTYLFMTIITSILLMKLETILKVKFQKWKYLFILKDSE